MTTCMEIQQGMIFEVKECYCTQKDLGEKWIVTDVNEDSVTLQYLNREPVRVFHKTKEGLLRVATLRKTIKFTDAIKRSLLRRYYESKYALAYKKYVVAKEALSTATVNLSIAITGVDPKEYDEDYEKAKSLLQLNI